MTSEQEVPPVIGAIADDREGRPLGTVTAVFVDDVTGQPTWVGLTDGLHAAADATDVAIVAPIAGAQVTEGRVRLTVTADAVHGSPRPATPDRLGPDEEVTLREHYAGEHHAGGAGRTGGVPDRTDTVQIDAVRPDTGQPDTGQPDTGQVDTDRTGTDLVDTDRLGADGTMTRSEERIIVDSVTEPWARAVLRIEEVTEEVMVPVTITRQQARIEYLPLRSTDGIIDRRAGGDTGEGPLDDGPAGADRAQAAADRGLRDSTSGWVTLYGEQPVVTMERVPIERVRLATSWVTEQRPVTDQVRREQIELTTDSPLA
jgi:stress response protein YsnF